ncbi:MAG: N-acetylmuramoyl-L-alanine amidase [Alphaproteobacteria bacterium]|nr:N-acetylmuramoyl-L-alanine amidase [Alphaproteobacteria bacterium]
MIECPSPNYNKRTDSIDMLVLHYTGMKTADEALDRMCDADAKVSAHYMIDMDGEIFKLVDESKRAWHAGIAFWRGNTDINDRSIGIELVNKGHEFGYHQFPKAQMDSLISLAKEILAKHSIPARNVVGHSDIAPTRKIDPAELFDWRRLAYEGIGVWADDALEANKSYESFKDMLAIIGYNTSSKATTVASLTAFQRHFLPNHINGQADSVTLARLKQILKLT